MTKPSMRPTGSRVVVQRVAPQAVSDGGIVIPESAQEDPKEGTVISVGPGRLTEDGGFTPLQVKVGDQVLYSSFAGTDIEIGGRRLLIMDEDDILAVLS